MAQQDYGAPIRVGIAGLGRSGWNIHAKTLAELADRYAIAAVCDPDEARQAEAHAHLNCRVFSDLQDLVADQAVELVVVATRSQRHAADAVAALKAGKHVLVEKPMACSLAEADEMIRAAEDSGRLLTVFQNYRYAEEFRKIRDVINSCVLGRLLLIRIVVHSFGRRWDWQTLKRYGGGILNNHGAHLVDWALQIIEDPAPQVVCWMETTPLYAGDAESHVKLLLLPETGPVIDIELTHACAYPQNQWLVMGTQGSLTCSGSTVRWKYFDPEEVPAMALDTEPTPDRSYNREELPFQERTYQTTGGSLVGPLALYRDLYATLRDGAPLAITPESVRRLMAVLGKCRESNPL
jgi:predicted dehydrogenase